MVFSPFFFLLVYSRFQTAPEMPAAVRKVRSEAGAASTPRFASS